MSDVEGDAGPDMAPSLVTCVRCGWVSYPVTRAEAEATMLDARRRYIERHPAQAANAPGFSEALYACMGCGGTAFRAARDGDCPLGCTINPVICEEPVHA